MDSYKITSYKRKINRITIKLGKMTVKVSDFKCTSGTLNASYRPTK